MTKLSKAFLPLMNEVVPSGYRLQEYGPLRAIVSKGGAPDEDRQFIIVGYASPQVIDREKHLIKREALAEDLPRFLAHPKYRNANIVHSNIQVAEVLPRWTNPDTGEEWTTHVDEVGLFCIVKLRTDRFRPAICKRVEEDILSGKLNSFSISGDAPFESRQYTCQDDQCFWVIDKIELYEITICEEGVNQDAKFSVVAKADAMRLSQFCADGSCPINLGGVGMMNPTETKSPSPAGGDASEGVATGAEGAKGLESDVAHDDPRQADQEKPGQDWVQKADVEKHSHDAGPHSHPGGYKSHSHNGPGWGYNLQPIKRAEAPSMIKRDVNPTAGGGGFNTTSPDQVHAAESEIEDDDGSFGSRVQKYLRKGQAETCPDCGRKLPLSYNGKPVRCVGCGYQQPTTESKGNWPQAKPRGIPAGGDNLKMPNHFPAGSIHNKADLGTMDHGISAPKLKTTGGGGKMTKAPDPECPNCGSSWFDPETGYCEICRTHSAVKKALTLPDNSEPTAIQKGGWTYPRGKGTLHHVEDHPTQSRGPSQDQRSPQGSPRHGAHDLSRQARGAGEGQDGSRVDDAGSSDLGAGPRAAAPGPSGASRQRASGRRRPEEPDRNDYWRAHEAAPAAGSRLLVLAAENARLATQLQLATQSDEERKRAKNEYMAKWRKEHGKGGGKSARASSNIQPSRITSPDANRQPNGSPEGRAKAGRPKMKMPEMDRTGHTAFDRQRAQDQDKKVERRLRREKQGPGSEPNGSPDPAPDDAPKAGREEAHRRASESPMPMTDRKERMQAQREQEGRDKGYGNPKKRPEPRRRAYGVEDPDDGAYDRRPTNESRALSLARQINAAVRGSRG